MLKCAVVGATGAVGRQMLADLEVGAATVELQVDLFASPRSQGLKLLFQEKPPVLRVWDEGCLGKYDVVFMSAGSAFSRQWSPAIVQSGAWVIDNSSCWRLDAEVPLVAPEVNGEVLKAYTRPTIIANPNCSTIQMVVALSPLQRSFGLQAVHVSTYQSVSGSGQTGVDALQRELQDLDGTPSSPYPARIAHNLLPAIGAYEPGGACEEEAKMIAETRKILALPELDVLASVVRVPVPHCHGETLWVRLAEPASYTEVTAALAQGEGLQLYLGNQLDQEPLPLEWAGQPHVG
ncbi:MAG: aspartate-semialdehyde dehydrogenase, partial [Zetaproteobacteria bacterium]|nr:aspartate-semialdehyde dehydrogenase [Zetaproteobacteria bacterium]